MLAYTSNNSHSDGSIWAHIRSYPDGDDENGNVRIVRNDARILRWNGNQWEEIERCPLALREFNRLSMFTAPDGNIQVADLDFDSDGHDSDDLDSSDHDTAHFNGNQWSVSIKEWPFFVHAITTAPDGSIWVGGLAGSRGIYTRFWYKIL